MMDSFRSSSPKPEMEYVTLQLDGIMEFGREVIPIAHLPYLTKRHLSNFFVSRLLTVRSKSLSRLWPLVMREPRQEKTPSRLISNCAPTRCFSNEALPMDMMWMIG